MNPLLVVASSCLLASSALAQSVGPGLTWEGSSSAFGGSFAPSCLNLQLTMSPPETVTVKVWGDIQAPFGLFASISGTQCLPLPGIQGAVILDFPIVPVTAGMLTLVTPCLSCPPGFQPFQFAVPAGLPLGTSLALQGVTLAGGNLALTIAITGIV
jgi:hypothetical protein